MIANIFPFCTEQWRSSMLVTLVISHNTSDMFYQCTEKKLSSNFKNNWEECLLTVKWLDEELLIRDRQKF